MKIIINLPQWLALFVAIWLLFTIVSDCRELWRLYWLSKKEKDRKANILKIEK